MDHETIFLWLYSSTIHEDSLCRSTTTFQRRIAVYANWRVKWGLNWGKLNSLLLSPFVVRSHSEHINVSTACRKAESCTHERNLTKSRCVLRAYWAITSGLNITLLRVSTNNLLVVLRTHNVVSNSAFHGSSRHSAHCSGVLYIRVLQLS